jgi:hypothetical protein
MYNQEKSIISRKRKANKPQKREAHNFERVNEKFELDSVELDVEFIFLLMYCGVRKIK